MADGGDGEALARAMAVDAEAVVYKMGSRGSRAFCGQDVIETPIFPVAALKSTGAGDAFMAGFATGLALGLDLKSSLRRGSAVAAIVVTRVGCAPAMPSPEELDAFLARLSIPSDI